MALSGKVAIIQNGVVAEVRDLGPDPVSVKPGTVLPFIEVYPELGAGDELAGYSDEIGKDSVTRTWAKTTPRRMIRKSVVQTRLIDAGKMGAAYAALAANPVYFARWFAPDRPEIYADDPDALLLLKAIGADAEAVMAR